MDLATAAKDRTTLAHEQGRRLSALLERQADLAGAAEAHRPRAVGAVVLDVRGLLAGFEALEAAHVTHGLRDAAFPFEAAQDELLTQRRAFAGLVRGIAGALASLLAPAERDELGRVAALAGDAPLTTRADLERIRTARRARGAA